MAETNGVSRSVKFPKDVDDRFSEVLEAGKKRQANIGPSHLLMELCGVKSYGIATDAQLNYIRTGKRRASSARGGK